MKTISGHRRATPGRGPAPDVSPRPVIDPRIRRRQIDVRRAAGRRRLRVLLAVVVVAGLGAAAWGAARSPLLDVDRVVVEGAANTGRGPVLAAAGVHPGDAMVHVDEGGAARAVSRLPWVRRTRVVREWPSTVRIRVVERRPVAVTRQEGAAWVLVDGSGRVLAPTVTPPQGLVIVDGVAPGGAPGGRLSPDAADALAVAAALPPGLAPRVATVTRGAGAVELHLKPQGIVFIGDRGQLDAKLGAALTVLGAVDGRTVSTLDVRIPSTPVLTRL